MCTCPQIRYFKLLFVYRYFIKSYDSRAQGPVQHLHGPSQDCKVRIGDIQDGLEHLKGDWLHCSDHDSKWTLAPCNNQKHRLLILLVELVPRCLVEGESNVVTLRDRERRTLFKALEQRYGRCFVTSSSNSFAFQ